MHNHELDEFLRLRHQVQGKAKVIGSFITRAPATFQHAAAHLAGLDAHHLRPVIYHLLEHRKEDIFHAFRKDSFAVGPIRHNAHENPILFQKTHISIAVIDFQRIGFIKYPMYLAKDIAKSFLFRHRSHMLLKPVRARDHEGLDALLAIGSGRRDFHSLSFFHADIHVCDVLLRHMDHKSGLRVFVLVHDCLR